MICHKFWIVWCKDADRHAPVKRHPDQASARAEAERLAQIERGRKYYVLEVVSRCYVDNPAPPITWENAGLYGEDQ